MQGVGSHAAHLLLRSGVGKLRLIDFDLVTLSSLNRHAVATREDVGSSKAKCLEKHFLRMVPEAEIESVVEMYTADKEEMLLGGNPDFVVDAIDNLDTKVGGREEEGAFGSLAFLVSFDNPELADSCNSWPLLSLQAHLIAACKRRGLRVLCSAGAGAKADPTRLRVVDMSEASLDPLARAVRHK
jgi:tRNA A37 threonylcarbamoyladenosine dehydratase